MKHFIRIVIAGVLKAALVLVLACVAPAFAVIHHIPANFATIQTGLNASATGDTVLVQPGIYYENITWPQTNGIKLIAAGDSSNTIIDGNQNGRVITMESNYLIDSTTVIDGFELRNGWVVEQNGGGIYLDGSSPTIQNTIIDCNSSEGEYPLSSGGGIYCDGSIPIIQGCSVRNNTAHAGGGIFCRYGGVVIRKSSIDNNTASFYAGIQTIFSHSLIDSTSISYNVADESVGGVSCDESSGLTITNSVVINNSANGENGNGGGLRVIDAHLALNNCRISENHAANFGGGISVHGSSLTVTDCEIDHNIAGELGGGIFCYFSSPTISKCRIVGNQASSGGGILCWDEARPSIDRSVIDGNSAESGGGIYCRSDASTVLKNTSITNNEGEGLVISSDDYSSTVAFNNFYNNSAGNFAGEGISQDLGVISGTNANGDSCDVYNNIYFDPRYVDAENGDYHLHWNSPCIDAGDPDSPDDPDGTIIDIGAFYHDQNTDVWEDRLTETTDLPARWTMRTAYPNPFNAVTTVTLALPQPATVDVSVFNTIGQQVATLVSGDLAAGLHALTFDALDLASGVYFIRATVKPDASGDPFFDQTQKVMLLR